MKKFTRLAKKCFKQEHGGVIAIEATILMPLMFVTLLCLLYLLFMVLSYITYSNIASNIAHQMNMRQTGYTEAYNNYSNRLPLTFTYGVTERQTEGDGGIKYAENHAGSALLPSDVIIDENETPLLRAGLYYAMDKCGRASTGNNGMTHVADMFILPFVQVDEIHCSASKKLTYNEETDRGNYKFANTVIKIDVVANCVNPFGLFNMLNRSDMGGASSFSSLIRFHATGYDVIA